MSLDHKRDILNAVAALQPQCVAAGGQAADINFKGGFCEAPPQQQLPLAVGD